MMNNFTPRAQQVLALARKEADRFNHNYVGTEHLLLGLIKLGQGVAVNVLMKMGLELENVRMEVEKHVGSGQEQKMVGNIPYTPRVKKVLALASKEARALNHSYVGTEHILLGLLREGEGVAAHPQPGFCQRLLAGNQRVAQAVVHAPVVLLVDQVLRAESGDSDDGPAAWEASQRVALRPGRPAACLKSLICPAKRVGYSDVSKRSIRLMPDLPASSAS
jgi:hypothetical protein